LVASMPCPPAQTLVMAVGCWSVAPKIPRVCGHLPGHVITRRRYLRLVPHEQQLPANTSSSSRSYDSSEKIRCRLTIPGWACDMTPGALPRLLGQNGGALASEQVVHQILPLLVGPVELGHRPVAVFERALVGHDLPAVVMR
jgi:hypothetical protein